MPRSFMDTEIKYVNHVIGDKSQNSSAKIIEISTTNADKLREFQRLLPNYQIKGVNLDIDEIQSLDPYKVVVQKAKDAFEKNNNNPILVEDTSLDILGLGGRPSTFVTFFVSDVEIRRLIAENWLKNKDRRAVARVILAIFDGKEVFTFEGNTSGTIAETLRGGNGFGFDDIFVPEKSDKTFAEMSDKEKDMHSMRRKAAEKLIAQKLKLGDLVEEIPEPFENELKRVRKEKINTDPKALKFAYNLEAIQGSTVNEAFSADVYKPIIKSKNKYYDRYTLDKESASIGLIITDIDKAGIRLHSNGEPRLWQMGPERRMLALAQRAEYFMCNASPNFLQYVRGLEKNNFHKRVNKRSPSLETILKYDFTGIPFNTKAIKELGYKKQISEKNLSRRAIASKGLFNKIGKYPRLMYGIGSMPAVSGWRDVIVTAAIGHMPVFVTRNNVFAGDTNLRINLIKQSKECISELGIRKNYLDIVERNIGVAIGTANPREQVNEAKRFFKEAGVRLFRIYTINSDPRFVETAELLRSELGNEIEIFAGQVVSKSQVYKLKDKANIDGVMIGHGGGRQCTSATNGMALTTVEEVYSLVTDHNFNDITIMVEGGVGRSVGALAILGVDGILYNQQFTRGTIETGGIFVRNDNDQLGQPYHGSASATTMIIESAKDSLTDTMLNYSGRTKVPEGKKGFTLYSEKANSMAFWVEEFKHQLARTYADLGVENVSELRKFIASYDKELLRIVSPEAAETAKAYKNRE